MKGSTIFIIFVSVFAIIFIFSIARLSYQTGYIDGKNDAQEFYTLDQSASRVASELNLEEPTFHCTMYFKDRPYSCVVKYGAWKGGKPRKVLRLDCPKGECRVSPIQVMGLETDQ